MPVTVADLLITLAIVSALVLGLAVAGDLLRRRRERLYLDRLADRGPRPDEGATEVEGEEVPGRIERRLWAAGLGRLSPLTYLAASAVLGLGAAAGIRRVIPDYPPAAWTAAAVVVYLGWVAIKAWGGWRARRFESKMVDAASLMVGALKAGQNLTQALRSAADAAEGAVRREFGEAAHRLDLGMNVRQALQRIERGYDSQGTRLFTRTIIAKWQAGGDLAPVLETVSRVIRERLRIRWRLQSQLAGARLSAVLIAVVPYFMIPFLWWQRPDWIDRVRFHPLGPRLFFAAVILQIMGLLWLRRIMRIEL